MEFGYWGIKGVAEPIRWLIAHLGLAVKEWNPASPEEWGTRKATTGPFPNLPFFFDGDFALTESGAIPVYLIHKAGKTDLLGKTLQDQARVRQIDGVLADIRQSFFKVLFAPGDHKENIGKAIEAGSAIANKVDQLAAFLGDKPFFLGYLTWADFQFAYLSQMAGAVAHSLGLKCPVAAHENLKTLIKAIVALPGVAERFNASKPVPFMPPTMMPFPVHTIAEIEAAHQH
jgi:glutathione S-transferase